MWVWNTGWVNKLLVDLSYNALKNLQKEEIYHITWQKPQVIKVDAFIQISRIYAWELDVKNKSTPLQNTNFFDHFSTNFVQHKIAKTLNHLYEKYITRRLNINQ